FLLLLSPFAPHSAEELWERLGHNESIAHVPWPEYDARKLRQSTVEVVLQVNGKVRSKLAVALNTQEDELRAHALSDANVRRHIEGKKLMNVIIVPNKLVNLVVK
ncbi:MAG TPA: class I tRNA ligase family protein, partial [Bacteroidota bacterium]|nr:class I tRNA ligase family protein [Bacteroidota bacterium]